MGGADGGKDQGRKAVSGLKPTEGARTGARADKDGRILQRAKGTNMRKSKEREKSLEIVYTLERIVPLWCDGFAYPCQNGMNGAQQRKKTDDQWSEVQDDELMGT